ncbi:hypothetical protein ACFQU1_13595 [Chelatococcus sp. GCM10030263]|uniref:hypothetical protein n=1 Tax=Chelatococcus sp. GCM10030263 TaxID=3273387 RepID=UPI0036138734
MLEIENCEVVTGGQDMIAGPAETTKQNGERTNRHPLEFLAHRMLQDLLEQARAYSLAQDNLRMRP